MTIQEKFEEERHKQGNKKPYRIKRGNRAVRVAKIEIQKEFDRNMIADEEREITRQDLKKIKQLLISQNEDLRYLEKEQNRFLQIFFAKSLEIKLLKEEVKQIKEQK